MNDLTPEDHALLNLARGGHEPTEGDRTRVRVGLLASLGVSAGLTVGTTAASATAGASAAAKVLLAIAVAGALGGGGLWVRNAVQSTPSSQAGVASVARPNPVTAPSAQAPVPRRAVPDDTVPNDAVNEVQTLASKAMDRGLAPMKHGAAKRSDVRGPVALAPSAAASTPAASTPTASVAPPEPLTNEAPSLALARPLEDERDRSPGNAPMARDRVEAETQLVAEGVSALHQGDASRALALFNEHARVYPNGVMAEERASERVMALCVLGRRSEAQAAAGDFLRARPHSPLAIRAQRECAGSSNP